MTEIYHGNMNVVLRGKNLLKHTVATIGVTNTSVLTENPKRSYLLIVNDSDKEVYITVGENAALNQGIRINPNGSSYEMSAAYGNLDLREINGITSIAGKKLLITEGE